MLKSSLFFLAAGVLPASAIPAFPGAEGYGANATGGRGGDVYHVTNLNPSGAGSFAEGISTVPAAGRTIVFDVSGYIRFPSGSNGVRLTSSKVTIAGQTAPGDGVGFYNNFFRISGDDIVIRHLRFRMGKYGSGGDCIDLDSGCLNAILDHVSMQFSTDENMSSFGSPPENLTLQYSLNAWGLESHSCGGLWDQNHATSHHNLWAHNHTRNPKARPNGLLEWVNNVTFDWDIGFIMGDSESVQSWKANVINNYFICPPGNTKSKALVKGTVATNNLPNFTVYLGGNLTDNDGDGILNGVDKGYSVVEGSVYSAAESPAAAPGAFRYYQSASPIAGSTVGVAVDAPLIAYKKVASNAGALRLDTNYTGAIRDEVDTILLNKLTTQTHFHVTRESDTGASASGFGVLASTAAPVDTDRDGMPDYYETALGWSPTTQDHNIVLANSGGLITGTTFFPTGTVSGYTRLEEYLQFLAIPHGTVGKNISGTPTSIQVDLRKFTSGFSNTPTFSLSNVSNGTTAVSGTGNYLVTFTPTLNYTGRARFDFTVTDAAGSSWTQTFALLVSQSGLPRDLNWKGDGIGNVWDAVANNWMRNGSATSFSGGDRVTFDDIGSLSPAVSVSGTVAPATVDVNAAGNYTFTGAGAVTASGTLTKRGTGSLTINNTGTNSFSAATLEGGTIALGNPTANASGLGTGLLTMNSGTLNFYDAGAGGAFTGTLPNALAINGNVNINTGARCGATGALSGAGFLNLYVPYIRTDWGGNPASFTGTLNVTTDGDGGEFRINNGGTGGLTDYGASRIWLADKVNAYFLPTPPSSGDKTQTLQIGELATVGTGSGVYLGGANGAADRIVNWKVGALNTSTTFGGVISNRTGPAALTKVGTGVLTLSGASTHTGATAVNAGTLIVAGSLGNTPVTVASGAVLAGSGTLGGSVTANAGAFLSPGTAPFTGATMNLNNGLTLNGDTLYFDMSNSPAGANDKIVMGGGALTMTGTQYFQFLLLQNTLAAGTYDLVTGAASISASGYTLTHNLPAGSRQTFALAPVGTTLRLTVTGDPAALVWTGATSANWDTVTTNNWSGAAPNTFYDNDAVLLNDTAGNRSVTLSGTLAPRTTTVDTALGYTLGGTGSLGGSGSLTKTGSGVLTISNSAASPFYGGTFLNGGSIVLNDSTANANGLGTGAVTFNGGTLTMAGFNGANSVEFAPLTNALVVPSGMTGTLNLSQRAPKPGAASVFPAIYGSLSGGGALNLVVKFIRGDVLGDWSAFNGVLNVLPGDGDGGDFRFGTSYWWSGLPSATVNLGNKIAAYYVGTSNSGAGTTVEFGELSGTSTSTLLGGTTSGRNFAYRIGGKTPVGSEVVFGGSIGEQTGVTTSYVKTGAGTWTLSGSGFWNGGTIVEQGTLRITGPFSCASATSVLTGATLKLDGGSLTTDAADIAVGAFFSGYGTLSSDLNIGGTMDGRGFSTGTPGTLNVSGSAFFDSASLTRLRGGSSSDLVTVGGDLSLAGTVQISLAAGTTFGRYPLFTYGGNLSMDTVALTGIPGGTTAKLSNTIAGQVSLVIDDSDEDGLPDSWEIANFGNLSQGPNDDFDGDGQNNAMELLTGTSPASGASRFAATIAPASATQLTLAWPSVPGKTYAIQTSGTLDGNWNSLISVPAAVSPATSTNYSVSYGGSQMFYRIALQP